MKATANGQNWYLNRSPKRSVGFFWCVAIFFGGSRVARSVLAMMKLLALLVVLRSVWATDFSIKTSKTEGNDADFASDTEGLCAVLLESCDVIMDCSAMSSYACSSISSSTITEVSGEYQMLFTGVVAEPYTECGESSCQDCTAYKTCVGPMIQTDSQTLEAGNCILWEYTTVGGSDAFEAFCHNFFFVFTRIFFSVFF